MPDERTYIRVHDGLDENRKIEELSDGAFRLLVSSWCYCSRNLNDGRITDAAWRKRGKPKHRAELVAASLAEQCDGYVQMHDYLEHQRSAEEVAEYRAKKKKASLAGNHKQYHVGRGVVDRDCELCAPRDGSDPSQVGSQVGSDVASQTPSQTRPTGIPSTETETEPSTYVEGEGHLPNARDTPPAFPDHCPKHAHDPDPPPCRACQRTREANEKRRETEPATDYRLRVVQPLCGQCDDRWINTPDGYAHCPRCHPAEVRTA